MIAGLASQSYRLTELDWTKMGMPPTLESTIRDLADAVGCTITLKNTTRIGGPGLVNFAARELSRLAAENEQLKLQFANLQASVSP
jgi:hypothetical protein